MNSKQEHVLQMNDELFDSSAYSLAAMTYMHESLTNIKEVPHLKALVPVTLRDIVPSICKIYGADLDAVSEVIANALTSSSMTVMKTGRKPIQKIVPVRDLSIFHQDLKSSVHAIVTNKAVVAIFPMITKKTVQLTGPAFENGQWNRKSTAINMAIIASGFILFALFISLWANETARLTGEQPELATFFSQNVLMIAGAYKNILPFLKEVLEVFGVPQPIKQHTAGHELIDIYSFLAITSMILLFAPMYTLGAGSKTWIIQRSQRGKEGKIVAKGFHETEALLEISKGHIAKEDMARVLMRAVIKDQEQNSTS